jgi:LCP family protein required for cell wall assembly
MQKKKPKVPKVKAKPQHSNKYTVGRTLSAYSSKHHAHTRPPVFPPEEIPEEAPRRKWKKGILAVVLVLFIPLVVIGVWDMVNYSRASSKLFGSGNLFSAILPTSLHGSDRGRVNVLVVGYSADDPGHAGAELTDSIMVLSLSTTGKQNYMLSIPRDLYISIPGYHKAKINEAYQAGQRNGFYESGYPNGGIGLLEKTIQEHIGVPIDYYALVNYASVRDITNALGGITVNIQSTDPRGIYDPNFQPQEGGPLQLPNGPQKIDGQTALRLTRARGELRGSYGLAQSDFDRTKNQQRVLVGIKQGITTKMLLLPWQNHTLLDAVADNVKTDIAVNEVLPLYRKFSRVPTDQLASYTLRDINGQNLLKNYRTSSGQSALVPAAGLSDYSDIRNAVQTLGK